jgi:hypothetical protein
VAERRVERRRNARVPAQGEVTGRIHAIKSAPVLNISERGLLIESPAVLRPGSVYTIRLGLDRAKSLSLRARVIRSYVHKVTKQRDGEGLIRYRAALAFEPLSEETTEALLRAIQSMKGAEEEF